MSRFNAKELTIPSVIALNYLSGIVKFETLPVLKENGMPTFKFKINYQKDGTVVEKLMTLDDVDVFLSHLKNTTDLLDAIKDDVKEE